MRIHETCTCGAEIEIEHDDPASVRADVTAWRTEHMCGGVQPWRRSARSTGDVRLDFGFVPDHDRPAEVTV